MDGKINIKRGTATVAAINPLQNSAYTRSVMGEETVTLSWEQPNYVELKIGDTIVHDAVTFKLNQLPTVKKFAKNNYRYDAVFQSPLYELLKTTYLLFDSTNTVPRGDFSLTGEPQAFVNLLVRNLNRIANGWTVGSVVTSEAKTISFSNENCFSVLQKLAQEFDTEFSVDGKSVNLNKITRVANLTLEYGSTLYDIERKTVDSADVMTRLYPFGGERNLKADYRGGSRNLLIPSPAQFIEVNADKYGIIEGTKTFEDIYPRLKAGAGLAGTITTVGDIFSFTDNNLDFDINAFLLPGTPAKVKFISGACSGYECEIKQYLNDDKKLVIIPNEDDKGWKIPQANIKPAVDDKYVLLDIAMPPAYVTRAEQELLEKATQYLQANSQPKVSYTVTISALYAKQNAIDIRPGDLVQVKDTELGVDTPLRAIKVTSEIKENYAIKIDLSATVSKSALQRIADEIEDNKEGVKSASKGVSQIFSRSWRDVQELAVMIDTLRADMLMVGNTQGQFSIKDTLFTPNYSNDKNKFYATPGELLHRAIPAAAPGTWTFPAYAPTLVDSTKPYYLYAKCSRAGTAGVYYFSEAPIKYDSNPADWFFLIGVLSSANNGIRVFQSTYGFTQITGKQVVTGTIQSADGSTYFDLDKGEIGGRITFKATTGEYADLADWADENSNDNIIVGGENLVDDSSFEDYRSIVSYVDSGNVEYTTSDKLHGLRSVKHIFTRDNSTDLCGFFVILNNADITAAVVGKKIVYFVYIKAVGSAVGRSAYAHIYTDKGSFSGTSVLLNGAWQQVALLCEIHPDASQFYSYIFGNFQADDVVLADCLFVGYGNRLTDWKLSQNDIIRRISETKNYTDTIKNDLQSQIDGNISSFFYDYEPAMDNVPAVNWSSTEVREIHLGDLFYWTSKGYAYRFQKVGGIFSWTRLQDTDVTKALANAANAQDTADGKRTTFITQPAPPYEAGDLWAQGEDGELMRCVSGRVYGQFVPSDWQKASKYTDDSAVDNLQIGSVNLLRNASTPYSSTEYWRAVQSVSILNGAFIIFSKGYAWQFVDIDKITQDTDFNISGKLLVGSQYFPKLGIFYQLQGDPNHQILVEYSGENLGLVAYQNTYFEKTFKLPKNAIRIEIRILASEYDGVNVSFLNLMYGAKGSRVHIKNQQDIQDGITQAKQAGLDAQNNLNTTNTTVNALNAEWGNATKDGLISEAEAKAIEKYINIITSEKAGLEATYNKLYLNEYLGGVAKTNLLSAKVTYSGKVENLLSAINTAISDGKTTEVEKQAVDTAYSGTGNYKDSLSAFQAAIEDSNKAIQAKLDAISKGYADAIEIGGVNTYIHSQRAVKIFGGGVLDLNHPECRNGFFCVGSQQGGATVRVSNVIKSNGWWTVSFDIKGSQSVAVPMSVDICDNMTQIVTTTDNNAWERVSVTAYVDNYGDGSIYNFVDFMPSYAYFFVRDIQVEKGNKATAYKISPEDVQAQIDEAKKAGTDAQVIIGGLKNFTDTAFKDGIIDRAEKVAIEKYMNSAMGTMVQVAQIYSKLFGNSYLTGTPEKADLSSKMSVLDTAFDDLYDTIDAAILDDIATPTEKNNINNKINTYTTALSNFQSAVENANKAIQSVLDGKAKGYADSVTVGGVNLIKNGNFQSGLQNWGINHSLNETPPTCMVIYSGLPSGAVSGMKITSNAVWQGLWQDFTTERTLELNKEYTLTFIAKSDVAGKILYAGHEVENAKDYTLTTSWQKFKKVFTPTQDKNFVFFLKAAGVFYISNIQLEEGNRATSYKNNSYLEDAIKGSTDINGGLVLGSVLATRGENGIVRSYISGLNDNKTAFASGVTGFGTADEQRTIELNHDGTAKFQGVTQIINKDDANYKLNLTPSAIPLLANFISGLSLHGVTITAGSPKIVTKDFSSNPGSGFSVNVVQDSLTFTLNKKGIIYIDISASDYHTNISPSPTSVSRGHNLQLVRTNDNYTVAQSYSTSTGTGSLKGRYVVEAGTYQIKMSAYLTFSANTYTQGYMTVGLFWKQSTYSESESETMIGTTGIASVSEAKKYFMVNQNEDTLVQSRGNLTFLSPDGTRGFRITDAGIQILEYGTWKSISLY